MSVIKVFNQHFEEFVDDILLIFPENNDIKKAKRGLEMMRQAKPGLIVKFWKEYIVPNYGQQIESGDIDFFLNKDYSGDIHGDDKIARSIDVLREPIKSMSSENKDKAMHYIQNLTKISKLYK